MARRHRRQRSLRRFVLQLAVTLVPAVLFYIALQTGVLTAFADWFGNTVADSFIRN
jgi:hypothetical protein